MLFYAQFVGFILQNMATRLGVVTGKHLAQLCKDEYGPRTVKSLWICAELSIVACDVQAVITSAIALRILFGWPLWVGCVVTGVDALTFLTLDVLGVHSLEGFFVLLVGMMAMCFFWNFSVNPPRASGNPELNSYLPLSPSSRRGPFWNLCPNHDVIWTETCRWDNWQFDNSSELFSAQV